MDQQSFRESLRHAEPPAGISPVLGALWYDAKGNWNKAHDLINDLTDRDAAHIHAYLHRKEGDAGNARYWYSRAGQSPCKSSLSDEWEALVKLYTAK